ncbi:MAG TPA: O-antigen ligase family protein [Candidatus Paceibacterota bacterium]|nr:O-antigen ligase family protein [Candidatus Paceibacterota bacterium]
MFLLRTTKSSNTVLRVIFYIFIALFPFINYIGHLYYGTTTRAENLFLIVELLVLCLGVILLNKKTKLSFTWSPIGVSLLLFLVFSFISGVNGVSFMDSFWSKATRTTGLFYLLHLGAFYIIFSSIFNDKNSLRNFLRVFIISSIILSIGSLLFTSLHFFGNSTFAGMYLYGAFLLSIYYIATSEDVKNRWWRFFIPLGVLINPYFINRELWFGNINIFKNPLSIIGEAQASSYVVFASIIMLLGILLISKIKNLKVRKGVIWGAVIVGFISISFASYSLISRDGYLQNVYLENASSARPIVWNLAKNSINARPLLGWGGDNFDRAFEKNYDNRLLENKNGPEPWFDRAHNIFIDQTVETGYIGTFFYLLIYIVLIGSMLYVLFKSKERNDHILASIIIVYFIGHFLELQTAFDTSISYIAVVVMLGLATMLFNKVYTSTDEESKTHNIPFGVQGTVAVLSIGLYIFFFIIGTVPIIRAENINGQVRKVGTSEKRIPLYPGLLGSPLDKPAFIWRTSSDIQRGIAQSSAILNDAKKVEGLKKEMEIFINEAKLYTDNHPDYYRMKLTLADLYIYEMLFGVDNLNKAQTVLDEAVGLYPEIPQAYWMKSVAYLYQQKFDLARQWAKKAYDLNPNIEESQVIINYIESSIKTFPNIDLFHFWQS